MLKTWIREGGKAYCIGPEEEMFPDIDVECPPCPGKFYEYSYIDKKWVKDDDKFYDYNKFACIEEIRRTDKFMVIDTPLTDDQIHLAKTYRSTLRNYLSKRPADVSLPTCPEFLK